MGFLGFLSGEVERGGEDTSVLKGEVDLDGVGPGHGEAHAFGIDADFVVIHREPRLQDDIVDPVQGGPAETELLALGGERGGGRIRWRYRE